LGQLDSQPSFVRLGVAGEDIKDKLGTIEDFDIESFLKVSRLGRVQIVVEQNDVCVLHFDERFKLLNLSFSEIRRLVWVFASLDDGAHDFGTRSSSQPVKFIERVVRFKIVRENQSG
jgi:hypothetical protein